MKLGEFVMQDMHDYLESLKNVPQSIKQQEKITTYLLRALAQQTGKSYSKILEEVELFSQLPDFIDLLTRYKAEWEEKTLIISQKENGVANDYLAEKFDFVFSEDLGIISLVMDKNKKGRLEREIGYLEFVEYDNNNNAIIVTIKRKDGSIVEIKFSEQIS